jgi:hypothetical protein
MPHFEGMKCARPAHSDRVRKIGPDGQRQRAPGSRPSVTQVDRLQRGAIAGGIGVQAGSEAGLRAVAPSPAAPMAGRLPAWTPAELGTNRTCGRFVGTRQSILVSLSDVDGGARSAGQTIRIGASAVPVVHARVLAVAGRAGMVPLVYAGGWTGCAAIEDASRADWRTPGRCGTRHLLSSCGPPD